MKLRSFVVSGALAASALLSAAGPASAEKVCAYAIPVEMIDKVYSGTARSGEIFRFKTTIAGKTDQGLIVPAGTLGYGVIREASAAGRHNHDGSIALEPRYLVVPKKGDGTVRLEVAMTPTLPVVWTPTEPLLQKAASHVPLPVPGLAMSAINTVRWGRNITLGPGFAFSVLPVGDLSHGPVC